METKFSGVTSLYLKHEIARLKRDPSHAVLFNFYCQGKNSDPTWLEDFGVSVSGRHGRNSIDGVKYFERVLQDGGKYGAHEVLIPKKLILVRRVSVHPDLEGSLFMKTSLNTQSPAPMISTAPRSFK